MSEEIKVETDGNAYDRLTIEESILDVIIQGIDKRDDGKLAPMEERALYYQWERVKMASHSFAVKAGIFDIPPETKAAMDRVEDAKKKAA